MLGTVPIGFQRTLCVLCALCVKNNLGFLCLWRCRGADRHHADCTHRRQRRERERKDERLYTGFLRLAHELRRQRLAGIVETAFYGSGRDADELGDLGDGHVRKIVQQNDLAHFLRQLLHRRADDRSVNAVEYAAYPGLVGHVRHFAGISNGGVRLSPHVGGVDVGHDLAHPGKEGRPREIAVNAVDHGGEGAVHELFGVRLVDIKTPGHGHKTDLVLDFQPFCAVFSVIPQLFDNIHSVVCFCILVSHTSQKVQMFLAKLHLAVSIKDVSQHFHCIDRRYSAKRRS